ncbi:MAG: hypothetical protein M5R36_10820 [Deltaproteobacteria bacterium]|nr:hypothetical protein [Deltaproteobacteria bacterium]
MRFLISLVVLTLILPAALAFADPAAKVEKIENYDVALVRFDAPETRDVAGGKTARYEQGYLVRVFGEFPIRVGTPAYLFVGDVPVEEYGPLPRGGGIYFMVFEKTLLDKMAGKEFRVLTPQKPPLPPASASNRRSSISSPPSRKKTPTRARRHDRWVRVSPSAHLPPSSRCARNR